VHWRCRSLEGCREYNNVLLVSARSNWHCPEVTDRPEVTSRAKWGIPKVKTPTYDRGEGQFSKQERESSFTADQCDLIG
jgi:hypothetical protein